MWKTCFIGVLLVFLVACTSSCRDASNVSAPDTPKEITTSPELSAIDSLMWQRPDSALVQLLSWFDTYRDVACNVYPKNNNDNLVDIARYVSTNAEYNRHYANLLLSELSYKNDSAQVNRAELLQAVDYFDSLVPQSSFLAARTHYMNGVGYYEHDDAVSACKEYMKALEITECYFKEKDLVGHKAQFIALTYTRLSMMFSDLYFHEQAIYFARISLHYYHKQNSPPWHLARMLSEIGTNYDMMNQLDSAKYYYQNAAKLLNNTNSLLFRDILTHQAYLKYEVSQQADSTINALSYLLAEAETSDEYLARAAIMGELFYHEKQYDSAWGYLKMVFDKTLRNDSKKQSAEWLKKICDIQGKNVEKYEYADFLTPFANQEENTSAIKSQLTELYNIFRQNALERQHRQVIRKGMTWTIVVLGGLLIMVLIIALLYHQNKMELNHFENVNPEENKTHSKAWDLYTAFMKEPICQNILRSIQGENIKRSATPKDYSNLILNDGQLQQLAFTVNRYFGSFEHQLEQHGIKANNIMVSLCHLYLLGIDEKQSAILLNRDYSSISRYGKKLKTAYNTQENLTVFFRNLVVK